MVLAPDIQAVVNEAHAPAGPTVAELRAAHDREAPESLGPGPRLARVGDLVIDGPHGWLPLRAYAPSADPGLPVVAYLHGGGWTVGSIASFDGVARTLAAASRRARREHRLPAGARAHVPGAGRRGGRGVALAGRATPRRSAATAARLAVAGDSAGANLAAVAARRLRDEGGPPLRMQALVYPVCDVGARHAVGRTVRRGLRLHRGGDAAVLGPLPRRRRRRRSRRLSPARRATSAASRPRSSPPPPPTSCATRARPTAPPSAPPACGRRFAAIPAPCTASGAGSRAPRHHNGPSARSARPCARRSRSRLAPRRRADKHP